MVGRLSLQQLVVGGVALACLGMTALVVGHLMEDLAQGSVDCEALLSIGVAVTMAAAAVVLLWVGVRRPGACVPPAVLEELVRLEQQSTARMAEQLHDTAVQSLVVATFLARNGETDGPALDTLTEQLLTAEREVRDVILEARPPSMLSTSLGAACQHLHQLLDLREGLEISWDWGAHASTPVPEVTADLVYRFLHETLGNVAKHSGAASAHVTLLTRDGELVVSVQDSGCGFTPPPLSGRCSSVAQAQSGLRLLAARATCLDARLSVTTGPGHGTAVTLRAALPADVEQTLVPLGAGPVTPVPLTMQAGGLDAVPTQRTPLTGPVAA